MKHLPHLAVFGGMLLSMLISGLPSLCILLGFAMPLLAGAIGVRQQRRAPVVVDPYAPMPITGPGSTFYLLAGFAMVAVAGYIWTSFLPLPEVLARRPFIAGGLHYTLGMVLSSGLIFIYLAWSTKRGVAR